MKVIGYIAAPTGAGYQLATHGDLWGFRGRAPRLYDSYSEAVRACGAIEKAGWRDGGRGRNCYVAVLAIEQDGRYSISAGGDGETGLIICGRVLGGDSAVDDAAAWLTSRPRRWWARRGLTPPT